MILRVRSVFALCLLCAADMAYAAALCPDAADMPRGALTLVVLDVETTGAVAERFSHELRLVLDNVAFVVAKPDVGDFVGRTPEEQLDYVSPLFERHRAAAAVWITTSKDGRANAHFATRRDDGASLQHVTTTQIQRAEQRLALTVRELLLSACAPRTMEPVPISSQLAAAPSGPRRAFRVGASSRMQRAARRHPRHWVLWGLGLDVETSVSDPLRGAVSVEGLHGPVLSSDEGHVTGWGMGATGSLSYAIDVKSLSIGMLLGPRVEWHEVEAQFLDSPRHRFRFWQAFLAVGARLAWQPTQRIALTTQSEMAWTPHRKVFSRTSTRRPFLSTAIWTWHVGVGIQLTFDAL